MKSRYDGGVYYRSHFQISHLILYIECKQNCVLISFLYSMVHGDIMKIYNNRGNALGLVDDPLDHSYRVPAEVALR